MQCTQGQLGGAIAPVGAPFLLLDGPRLLSGELRSVLARDLHRVILGHLVFVLGPLEKATLLAGAKVERRKGDIC